MTAREKAKELVDKYSFVEIAYHTSMFEVKQCALIAVDECLKCCIGSHVKYWEQVKHEIEQL